MSSRHFKPDTKKHRDEKRKLIAKLKQKVTKNKFSNFPNLLPRQPIVGGKAHAVRHHYNPTKNTSVHALLKKIRTAAQTSSQIDDLDAFAQAVMNNSVKLDKLTPDKLNELRNKIKTSAEVDPDQPSVNPDQPSVIPLANPPSDSSSSVDQDSDDEVYASADDSSEEGSSENFSEGCNVTGHIQKISLPYIEYRTNVVGGNSSKEKAFVNCLKEAKLRNYQFMSFTTFMDIFMCEESGSSKQKHMLSGKHRIQKLLSIIMSSMEAEKYTNASKMAVRSLAYNLRFLQMVLQFNGPSTTLSEGMKELIEQAIVGFYINNKKQIRGFIVLFSPKKEGVVRPLAENMINRITKIDEKSEKSDFQLDGNDIFTQGPWEGLIERNESYAISGYDDNISYVLYMVKPDRSNFNGSEQSKTDQKKFFKQFAALVAKKNCFGGDGGFVSSSTGAATETMLCTPEFLVEINKKLTIPNENLDDLLKFEQYYNYVNLNDHYNFAINDNKPTQELTSKLSYDTFNDATTDELQKYLARPNTAKNTSNTKALWLKNKVKFNTRLKLAEDYFLAVGELKFELHNNGCRFVPVVLTSQYSAEVSHPARGLAAIQEATGNVRPLDGLKFSVIDEYLYGEKSGSNIPDKYMRCFQNPDRELLLPKYVSDIVYADEKTPTPGEFADTFFESRIPTFKVMENIEEFNRKNSERNKELDKYFNTFDIPDTSTPSNIDESPIQTPSTPEPIVDPTPLTPEPEPELNIDSTTTDLTELEQLRETVERSTFKIKTLETEKEQLAEENKQLAEENKQLKNDYQELEEEQTKKVKELAVVKQEKRRLKENNQRLAEAADKSTGEITKTLEKTQQELEKCTQRTTDLEGQLEAVTTDLNTAKQEKKEIQSSLQQEKFDLDKRNADLQNQIEKLQENETQAEAKNAEIQRLKEALEELDQQKQDLEEQCKMWKDYADREDESPSSTNEQTVTDLEDELETCKQQIKANEKKIERLRLEKTQLEDTNTELKGTIETNVKSAEEQTERISSLENDLNQCNDEIAKRDSEIKQLRQQIEENESAKKQLPVPSAPPPDETSRDDDESPSRLQSNESSASEDYGSEDDEDESQKESKPKQSETIETTELAKEIEETFEKHGMFEVSTKFSINDNSEIKKIMNQHKKTSSKMFQALKTQICFINPSISKNEKDLNEEIMNGYRAVLGPNPLCDF